MTIVRTLALATVAETPSTPILGHRSSPEASTRRRLKDRSFGNRRQEDHPSGLYSRALIRVPWRFHGVSADRRSIPQPEFQHRFQFHASGQDSGHMTKIYVGNLPFSTTDDALRSVFEQYGEVASASVVMDRETGRSRGFGFVEMPNAEEATNAINSVNGQPIDGRNVTVNEARPREQRAGGGGGFGGGGGRRGGGGGGRGGWGGGGGGRSSGGGGGGWSKGGGNGGGNW
jgi:hypothetical protein